MVSSIIKNNKLNMKKLSKFTISIGSVREITSSSTVTILMKLSKIQWL